MGTGAARADDGPVLVIGATGHQGGAVARQLLDTERRVRALVRDPGTAAATALQAAGAELAVGDLDEPDTVKAALDGVAGVFLALTMMTGPRITAEGVVTEQRHGTSVVHLAKQAGVGHLVYSCISGANTGTGIPYYESKARIEERIRALGVPATILRPVTFMDNFATYNKPAIRDGELVVSLAVRPDRPMALIAVRDIGAFAVLSFTHPDEFIGRAIDIAGDALTPNRSRKPSVASRGSRPGTTAPRWCHLMPGDRVLLATDPAGDASWSTRPPHWTPWSVSSTPPFSGVSTGDCRADATIRFRTRGGAGRGGGGPVAAGAVGGVAVDLLGEASSRSPAPTFAEYVPVVSGATSAGTKKAYWNRIVEHWVARRLDEPRPSEIEQLATAVELICQVGLLIVHQETAADQVGLFNAVALSGRDPRLRPGGQVPVDLPVRNRTRPRNIAYVRCL